jgi:Lar family restriction alleviation protein
MPAANYAHKHKLKPCPFCGSADLTLDNLADPKHGWFVNCNICEIQQIANYTEAQAVALWNKRTTDPIGDPTDPNFRPTSRDLIALRADAAATGRDGLSVKVSVAPAVLYMSWPNAQHNPSDGESSPYRCISFHIPKPE